MVDTFKLNPHVTLIRKTLCLIFILYMRKLRHTGSMYLEQGHAAKQCQQSKDAQRRICFLVLPASRGYPPSLSHGSLHLQSQQ